MDSFPFFETRFFFPETDKREQDASVHVSKEDEKTSFASADKSDRETFSTRDEGIVTELVCLFK